MLTWLVLVLLLPLGAFTIQIFLNQRLPRKGDWLSTGAIGLSLVISTVLFTRTLGIFNPVMSQNFRFEWLNLGSFRLPLGILYDNLTAVMLMVVCIVSFLVHLFSIGYMHNDPRYGRYFAYLGIFSFSMLGLVLCDNIFALYIFWELVGLSSYLLIGFWFEKKSASDAAKKAFITTRIGDVGMFIGLLLVYNKLHVLGYREIFHAVAVGQIAGPYLTAAGICLFFGAVGKSAQFPLHVWLPDAMEGPTPVSALIHAATMVAAGVYMVGRLFLVFTPDALVFIAVIGVVTACLAATIAIVMTDIKKVLAYSTISQLGYMIAALGVGAYTAGLYHLMTHAFFKALLFLGSGSVIHAVHSQEMPEMGGLRRKMPVTFWTFLMACLAISGFPLFSGFFSKDMILGGALANGMAHPGQMIIFILLLLFAGVTSFYMFRILFLTFTGSPRDKHKHEHAHESPAVMTIPLIMLGILSVGSAWGNWFPKLVQKPRLAAYATLEGAAVSSTAGHLQMNLAGEPATRAGEAAANEAITGSEAMAVNGAVIGNETAATNKAMAADERPITNEGGVPGERAAGEETESERVELAREHKAETIAMPLSIVIALSGIFFSWLTYAKGKISAAAAQRNLRPIHTLLARKYYLDEIYLGGVVRPVLMLSQGMRIFDNKVIDGLVNGTGAFARLLSWITGIFDNKVVDGAVNGVGWTMVNWGKQVRRVQTGRVQNYALGLFAVALVLILVRLVRGF
jgi:NADH-quinone oxidoreductase subunit L